MRSFSIERWHLKKKKIELTFSNKFVSETLFRDFLFPRCLEFCIGFRNTTYEKNNRYQYVPFLKKDIFCLKKKPNVNPFKNFCFRNSLTRLSVFLCEDKKSASTFEIEILKNKKIPNHTFVHCL